MGKKKHIWHCYHCNSECMIYKKGKKHHVIVCPRHGIIAENPGMGALIGGALGSVVPGVGTAIGAGIGTTAEYGLGYLKKRKEEKAAAQIQQESIPRSVAPPRMRQSSEDRLLKLIQAEKSIR